MTPGPKPRPPIERALAKVDKAGPIPTFRPELGPCWIWTGGLDRHGYARLYGGSPRRSLGVHRLLYEHFVGAIPDGLDLDHLCRVTRCVNPAHLEPVTRRENVLRGAHGALKTHCAQGHRWAGDNIATRRDGTHRCAQCHRDSERARRIARAA